MIEWKLLQFSESAPLSAKLDRLENQAAIYSFDLNVDIDTTRSPEHWLSDILELLSLPHGTKIDLPLGFYETAKLRHVSSFSPSFLKMEKLGSCIDRDPGFVQKVSLLLGAIQFALPPLYVGETSDLRERVSGHLSGNAELLKRFNESGLELSNLVLKYFYLQDIGVDLDLSDFSELEAVDDDELAAQAFCSEGEARATQKAKPPELLFIEELLSRLLKPRFIHKLGANPLPKGK